MSGRGRGQARSKGKGRVQVAGPAVSAASGKKAAGRRRRDFFSDRYATEEIRAAFRKDIPKRGSAFAYDDHIFGQLYNRCAGRQLAVTCLDGTVDHDGVPVPAGQAPAGPVADHTYPIVDISILAATHAHVAHVLIEGIAGCGVRSRTPNHMNLPVAGGRRKYQFSFNAERYWEFGCLGAGFRLVYDAEADYLFLSAHYNRPMVLEAGTGHAMAADFTRARALVCQAGDYMMLYNRMAERRVRQFRLDEIREERRELEARGHDLAMFEIAELRHERAALRAEQDDDAIEAMFDRQAFEAAFPGGQTANPIVHSFLNAAGPPGV